jgi:benzoate membrane transport protein
MPGMLVLRNDGFKTSANPILTVTGLGSLLMAPFGSHAFNVAAITAAICTGKESHEEAGKRYIAGLACGVFYILVGVFGTTLAALFVVCRRLSSRRWPALPCSARLAAALPRHWSICADAKRR